MSQDIPISRLANVSMKMRDQLAQMTREYEAQYKELAEKKARVDNEMLRQMQERGVTSEKIEGVGTVYIYKSVKASLADDQAFFSWVKEKDAFDALERRIKSSFVQTYMDDHDGVAPPGLSVFTEVQARMRKASESK